MIQFIIYSNRKLVESVQEYNWANVCEYARYKFNGTTIRVEQVMA